MNWLKIGELSKMVSSICTIYCIILQKISLPSNVFFTSSLVSQIIRATVLYDQPPEFFRPASLEEKHKVLMLMLCLF